VRRERSISTIADLYRYRKQRIERQKHIAPKASETYKTGLTWSRRGRRYSGLPRVLGLDGQWREIPREVLGDFTKPA